jgi:hypothetical protein
MGATLTARADDGSFSDLFCQGRARASTVVCADQAYSAENAVSAGGSDEFLMRRYQRGDDQAFQQLYGKSEGATRSYLLNATTPQYAGPGIAEGAP